MKMEKEKNFEYDERIDNLTIYHNQAKNEPVLGSIVVGNLIFDIGVSGSFVSLEIDNASKIFNLTKENLIEIKEAKIKSVAYGNMILLIYSIFANNKEYERTLMIPKNKIQLTN